jgi:hypothetical protein
LLPFFSKMPTTRASLVLICVHTVQLVISSWRPAAGG